MGCIQSKDLERAATLLLPQRVGHLDPGPCFDRLVGKREMPGKEARRTTLRS
jgi:hypothetical protein